MSDLAESTCQPCRGDTPELEPEAARALLSQLKQGWEVVDGHHLRRTWSFEDFAGAMAFVVRVGEVAEAAGHHPDICFTWGRAEVQIHTHAIDGLSEADFVLAAKIDRLS